MELIRTTSKDPDFISLVEKLDAYLTGHNGKKDVFYSQFNKIDLLENCIVAYIDEKAVSCGAFKKVTDETIEIKRMYTLPEFRKQHIAKAVLSELEQWAKELGFKKLILETGLGLQNAQKLYAGSGYDIIENYGPYINVKESVCFSKLINNA